MSRRRSTKLLELAYQEAYQFGDEYVGTEHILLAILKLDEGVACDILRLHGITILP